MDRQMVAGTTVSGASSTDRGNNNSEVKSLSVLVDLCPSE